MRIQKGITVPEPLRVLIVEDSVDDTFLIVRTLQRGGFQVEFERVETAIGMQAALEVGGWQLIISDYSMPSFSGLAALQLYQRKGADMPFIIVSGAIGEERAVEIVKAGAHNYVMKECWERLVPVVRRELLAANERRIRSQTEAKAAYLVSLVDSCEDSIVGTNLEGTVLSWNAGAERLYGYTAVEIVGRSIGVLYPHYRPEGVQDILEKIRAGGVVECCETVRLRKDGSPVEVSLTISPIRDGAGCIIGASGVSRDITQRKRQENERLGLIQELTAALAHQNNAQFP